LLHAIGDAVPRLRRPFFNSLPAKIMFKTLTTLILSALMLAACGGGGGGDTTQNTFTFNNNTDGTSFSCPTKATLDQCTAGSCGECTCTKGCASSSTKVKLSVILADTNLKLNQQTDLTLKLDNKADVAQTVKFKLVTPSGPVGYSVAVPFSNGCKTLSQTIGGNTIAATVVVPANNSVLACEFKLRKTFTVTGSPLAFTLEDLDKVELEGSLPVVNVTP
jgi:hypothetical protein